MPGPSFNPTNQFSLISVVWMKLDPGFAAGEVQITTW